MENERLKSQIDLFLTEISIELLGNKIYDINGNRQDKLINLFKALPENHSESAQSHENKNDFLCSLGYQSDFSNNEASVKEFLDDQLDYIIKDANNTPHVNEEVIKTLRNYKADQQLVLSEFSEMNIKIIVEKRNNIVVSLNNSRSAVVRENRTKPDVEKIESCKKYYAQEKNDLLKMSMDTLRLLKYILNDPQNEAKKGEMIGYLHAMRRLQVKNKNNKGFPGSKMKPYRIPKVNLK